MLGPSAEPTPASTSFCTGVAFGGTNDGYGTAAFGVYSLAGVDSSGVPYYSHASGTYHMYIVTWMYGAEWWFISETNGAASGQTWYASKGSTSSPTDASDWTVYDDSSAAVTQSGVLAACAASE